MSVGGVRRVVDRALEWLLVAFMSAMVLNVLWQVATRFVLHNPSSYTEEIARYLLVWVGVLGGAYAVGKRIHLAIDLLPTRSSKERRKAMLELFIEVCIFVFAALVLVFGGCGPGVVDPRSRTDLGGAADSARLRLPGAAALRAA